MARGHSQSQLTIATARATVQVTADRATDLPALSRARVDGAHKHLLNYRCITGAAQLRALISRYRHLPEISLDIETAANRGFGTANGAMRLIQIGVEDPQLGAEQAVVDCFAVDPTPLLGWLGDRSVRKLIHYAPFEKEWFRYHHGVWLHNSFDTCSAWRAIHTHREAADPGYGSHTAKLKDVVALVTGVEMDKEQQASDWGRPRLSTEQIEYAALDVAILPQVAREAQRIIDQLGLHDELAALDKRFDGRVHSTLRNTRERTGPGEAALVERVLNGARTRGELARVWRAARQVAVHHEDRAVLRELYRRRYEELTPAA